MESISGCTRPKVASLAKDFSDHQPPHFHTWYGEYKVIVNNLKRFFIKFNTFKWENGVDFAPEYLYEIGTAA